MTDGIVISGFKGTYTLNICNSQTRIPLSNSDYKVKVNSKRQKAVLKVFIYGVFWAGVYDGDNLKFEVTFHNINK